MNPAEACRYMADPANWSPLATWLFLPGAEAAGRWDAQRLAAMALTDTAEIVPTAMTESRPESRPCVECHKAILPGEAYAPGPIHARHAPRR